MVLLNPLKITLPFSGKTQIKPAETTITGCKSSDLGGFEDKYFPRPFGISISKYFLSREKE